MSKDYAKKSRSSKKTGSTVAVPWVWLFGGLFIGLLIAGILYVKERNLLEAIKRANFYPEPKAKTVKTQTVSPKPIVHKPKFDFYTILPAVKVPTNSQSESKKITRQVAKPVLGKPNTVTKPTSTQYVLQVVSLKRYKDADKIKAELLLLGFNAKIEQFEHKGQKWYRVRVGPYTSSKAAHREQAKLRNNKIKSLLIAIG